MRSMVMCTLIPTVQEKHTRDGANLVITERKYGIRSGEEASWEPRSTLRHVA